MIERVRFLVLLSATPSLLLGQVDHRDPSPASQGAPARTVQSFQPRLEQDVSSYQLDQLLEIALETNPTVQQAEAGVEHAEGIRRQVGRYPNPTVGATGDENTSNTTFRGGEIGLFVEQRIVTAGKLSLNKQVADQQANQARAVAAAQQQRVESSVRQLFYEALGAQWDLDVHRRIADLTAEAAGVTRELANVGQADQPDVLRGEIEAQRSQIELRRAANRTDFAWSQLRAMVGSSSLERRPLRGELERFPQLDHDGIRKRLLQESPQIAFAAAGIDRANLAVERAKVDKWPDIMVHGGFRNSPFIGRDGNPIGKEGFFDVGIEIPVFDRRKGSVKAARADARRAELEGRRIRLELTSSLAEEYREYQDALATVEILRDEMLPRAVQAYETYRASFDRMAAAYPQVLIARRNLLELEKEYVDELVTLWHSTAEIEGLLLSGGLEAPSAAAASIGRDRGDDRLTPTALRRRR